MQCNDIGHSFCTSHGTENNAREAEMDCDRCGRTIEGGALVGVGARRFRSLCRTCWTVETRSSNSRLISALNEMTRRSEGGGDALERRAAAREDRSRDRRRKVVERREDPERPRWHP